MQLAYRIASLCCSFVPQPAGPVAEVRTATRRDAGAPRQMTMEWTLDADGRLSARWTTRV
jgi:hypothetical protein